MRSTSAMVSRASFSAFVDQDRRRGRAVLGLAEQVGGAHLAVDAVVGDDQRPRSGREQIDADAAEQLTLGFRHIGVAGPDYHVDRADCLGAERHGGGLPAPAEHVDVVAAAECMAATIAGCGPPLNGGAQAAMRFTPATARGPRSTCARRPHRIAPARHVAGRSN